MAGLWMERGTPSTIRDLRGGGKVVLQYRIIDTDVVNDPYFAANAAVPAGFAGSRTADRFFGNLGRIGRKSQ
jgi:hypothetical protein